MPEVTPPPSVEQSQSPQPGLPVDTTSVPTPVKKTPSALVWIMILVVLLLAIIGGVYYYFSQVQTSSVELLDQLDTDVTKPDQGFISGEPTGIPTLTQGDTTSDIEKDLSNTQLSADESSFTDLNADLQGL